jgi:hypothetical protein
MSKNIITYSHLVFLDLDVSLETVEGIEAHDIKMYHDHLFFLKGKKMFVLL